MCQEIEEQVQKVLKDFEELDCYQKYTRLKKELASAPEIRELESAIKQARKKIKDLAGDQAALKVQIAAVKKLEARLYAHPLNVNYRAYKERLEELLAPLRGIFSE